MARVFMGTLDDFLVKMFVKIKFFILKSASAMSIIELGCR